MQNSYPRDRIFNPHLTTNKDSYNLIWRGIRLLSCMTSGRLFLCYDLISSKPVNVIGSNQTKHFTVVERKARKESIMVVKCDLKIVITEPFFKDEPGHEKMCLIPYANNKGADQPAHTRSLISTFIVRCLHSIVCIFAKSKISRLYLASVAEQAGLSLVAHSRRQIFSWQGSDVYALYL